MTVDDPSRSRSSSGPMAAPTARASTRQRALVGVALLAVALLVVAVIVFLVHNAGYVVMAAASVVLAVAGAWWAVAERQPRRTVGAVAVVVGGAGLVAALLLAGDGVSQTVLRTAVVAALVTVCVASARAALVESFRPMTPAVGPAPSHPVLLCNPWSGGGKVDRFGLVDLAASLGVETVMLDRGLDLEELARDAVRRGADCMGMAGGTARRPWWPRSQSSTVSRSFVSRPAPGTTSRSISGSTVRTRGPGWPPSARERTAGWTTPP